MKKLEKLYEQARFGNKEAILELFNRNCNFIEKKAHFVFDSIKLNVESYYKLENVPNSLIDYEDIEQDLKLRMYEIILKYLDTNSQLELSSYISHMIKSYIESIIANKTTDIINRLKNVSNNQISEFYNFEDRNTIFELIDLVRSNPKFKNHAEFICDIFKGLTYEELAKKYNLHIKGLSVKMKTITKLYQDSLNCENVLYNYIVSGDIIKELRYGDIFKISYFKDKIIFTLHEIYSLFKNYYINFKKIKIEYLSLLCKYINVRKDKLNNNDDIDKFMDFILNNTKQIYINHKQEEVEYIRSCNYDRYYMNDREISEDEAYNQILKGHIYNIYPYCEYIDMIIEEIYNELSKINYTEKNRLKEFMKLSINKMLLECFNGNFNIQYFNRFLKRTLTKKKKIYIKRKTLTKK